MHGPDAHNIKHDKRENDSQDGAHSRQQPAPRIHRVCVTCNNMFETDRDHLDAKYCPVCRRA